MKHDRTDITEQTVGVARGSGLRGAIAALGLVALGSCGGGGSVYSSNGYASDNSGIVATGASADSGGWFFSAGNRFLIPGEPGLLFGVQHAPEGPREFSYVTLLRLPLGRGVQQMDSDVTVRYDDGVATLEDVLTIDEAPETTPDQREYPRTRGRWKLSLTLETDGAAGTIQPTALTLNGEALDPAHGLLLLVDLTSSPATYEQLDTALPTDPPVLDSTDMIRSYARQLIGELGVDERVRAFLGE